MHTAVLHPSRAAQDAVSLSSHLLLSFLLREKKLVPNSTGGECLRVPPPAGTECGVAGEEPPVNLVPLCPRQGSGQRCPSRGGPSGVGVRSPAESLGHQLCSLPCAQVCSLKDGLARGPLGHWGLPSQCFGSYQ